MILFAANLLIAAAAAVVTGVWGVGSMLLFFAAGYAALWVPLRVIGVGERYFRTVWRTLRLIGFFLYELVVSSIAVVWDVLTPQHLSQPAIIEMPLDVTSDEEILLVTNLISLTPGTLSLDVSEDRKSLYVHAMFADDPDAVVRQLKNGMERMVREVFEP